MLFSELNLPDYILVGLERQGIYECTEIQERTIPLIREGRDVIGKSQTGSGKTYAFAIPLIESIDIEDKSTQVLIVCPTRELAGQVTDEMRKLTSMRESCKIVPIFGGADMDRQIKALKSSAKIVVGTPGRIMDHVRRRTLRLSRVRAVVLDEADEMLNMGFKDDVESILSSCNPLRQTIMFSATMPRPILDITDNYMSDAELVETAVSDRNAQIDQYYVNVGLRDKTPTLIDLIREHRPRTAIVFCNTKKMVDTLTVALNEAGIDAKGLHGDMRQSFRKKVMTSIKSGETAILVATDVAARGIDIVGVDVVYNYDIPLKTEYYTHRIGRTARAGRSGVAYTLINTKYQLDQLTLIHKDTDNVIGEYITKYSVRRESSMRVVRGDRSRGREDRRGVADRTRSPKGKTTRVDRYRAEGRYLSSDRVEYADNPRGSYNGSDRYKKSAKRYGDDRRRDATRTTDARRRSGDEPPRRKSKPTTNYHVPKKKRKR